MYFNDFINYLNSLHNASGNNKNAIAENQILNNFYSDIMVKRPLGDFLLNKLKEENLTIILTGHAGDGKTSLLYQLLKSIGEIKEKTPLEKFATVTLDNKPLMYIKDMSELDRQEQNSLMEKGLETSLTHGSSIIISNTGPLIRVLKEVLNKEDIENDILERMDLNDGKFLKNIPYKIMIINIAKLDNTDFIYEFLKNISQNKFLEDIEDNHKNSFIFNNLKLINENLYKVSSFVTNFYRNAYEKGDRFTLRQIIAHITYSITCNYNLENSFNKDFLYHNIFNNFFGYNGDSINNDAKQIKGIEKLISMNLDGKKIYKEDSIFIDSSFDNFIDSLNIKDYWVKQLNNSVDSTREEIFEKSKISRKFIRRALFFFNNFNKEEEISFYNSIFSNNFSMYIDSKYNCDFPIKEKNELEKIIKEGLFKLYTGFTMKRENSIYLTLKRDGEYIQNIQLILGELDKRKVKIIHDIKKDLFNNRDFGHLFINLKDTNTKIPLNLPIIEYFTNLKNGIINTNVDPQLNNGIDKIKFKILNLYKYDEDENMQFLILTNKGSKVIEMTIDNEENTIIVD